MTEKQQALLDGEGAVVMTRYGNRKLYVQNLGYVEMPFLRECLRRCRPIQVRNFITGQDDTALVLGRILVEAAKSNQVPVGQLQGLLEGIYAQPQSAD